METRSTEPEHPVGERPIPVPADRSGSPVLSAASLLRAAVTLAFCAVAGVFAPLTAPAEFAVLIAGTLVAAWALGARLPGAPPLERRPAPDTLPKFGWLLWLMLALLLTGWELYSLWGGPSELHPTLSALSRPLLAPPWHRAVAYLVWLRAGVWVAHR